MSLTGSLMPSVPLQLAAKIDPPMITIVYHFENETEKDAYGHTINLDKNMLLT